jgi:Glycosyltransferase Family 4
MANEPPDFDHQQYVGGACGNSELYVRDVALALLERGHSPIAYSSLLGEVAEELRAATVPVIDRLDALAVAPDLIHGHHHLETMTALLHFPNVPALSFCHGWLPWEEMPPKFSRISRYVAVDQTCRDRLILEHAIPEQRVRLLLNFVDLKRFKPRAALPQKPKRALVFSNYASEENILPTIRAACVHPILASTRSACAAEILLADLKVCFPITISCLPREERPSRLSPWATLSFSAMLSESDRS